MGAEIFQTIGGMLTGFIALELVVAFATPSSIFAKREGAMTRPILRSINAVARSLARDRRRDPARARLLQPPRPISVSPSLSATGPTRMLLRSTIRRSTRRPLQTPSEAWGFRSSTVTTSTLRR